MMNNQSIQSIQLGTLQANKNYDINQIQPKDYTGVIGVLGVFTILGIMTLLLLNYWIKKFFEHKQSVDERFLEYKCKSYAETNVKLDTLIATQKEFIREIKICKN